jgi:Fe-S-cluster containining protein
MLWTNEHKRELCKRALVDSDREALTTLLLNTTSPRLANLIVLQYVANNLKDKCHNCSICCENEELISVAAADVRRISVYLKMPVTRFIRRYVKKLKKSKMSLRRTLPCVFLRDGRCSIYPVRPTVCAMYPFLAAFQSDFLTEKTDLIAIPKGCSSALRAYTLMTGLGLGGILARTERTNIP